MVEIIVNLFESSGKSGNSILKELSLSPTAISEWKKGKSKPTVDALIKIADYFGVSVDYLLGRDAPNAIIERPTAEFAEKYKHLFTDEDFVKIAKVYEAAQDIKVKGLLAGYFLAAAKASGVDTTVVGY